jgi:hypothetical protein
VLRAARATSGERSGCAGLFQLVIVAGPRRLVRAGGLDVLIEEEIVDLMGEAAGEARFFCELFTDAFAMLVESLAQLGDDAVEFFGRLRSDGLVPELTDVAWRFHELRRVPNRVRREPSGELCTRPCVVFLTGGNGA